MALLISYTTRCIVLLGILAAGICRAEDFNEYHVKAAFLYTFAKFVEWPPEAYSSPYAAITICVLGDDPFGNFLDDAVRGKTVGGRTLAIFRMADIQPGRDCKILFIAASEHRRMGALVASVGTSRILTVGDTEGFTTAGGMIGLRMEGERIRLSVNLPAADKAKLRISSRLLSLATIVK